MISAGPGCFNFDTNLLPLRDRFPVFCEEVMRRYTGLDVRAHDGTRFSAALRLRRLGAINIGYNSVSALDCVRTRELLGDGDDGLVFVMFENGTGYYTQLNEEGTLAAGDAVLCDSAYSGECNFTSLSYHWHLKIPRAKLAELLPDRNRFAGSKLDRDRAARSLLFGYLKETINADLRAGDRAAQLYEDHIVDLVALALGAGGDTRREAEARGARAARRSAILREIKRRSSDPHLSAVIIALLLGITPRYVHLLLEETGKSFSHHVLERRLDKAAALLGDPEWRGRKIADIAAQAGFTDLSYFNRAFRRHFGATPSDIREAASRGD
jgi:AraC-like DNA-binding protein